MPKYVRPYFISLLDPLGGLDTAFAGLPEFSQIRLSGRGHDLGQVEIVPIGLPECSLYSLVYPRFVRPLMSSDSSEFGSFDKTADSPTFKT